MKKLALYLSITVAFTTSPRMWSSNLTSPFACLSILTCVNLTVIFYHTNNFFLYLRPFTPSFTSKGFPSLIEGDLYEFLKAELEENTSFVVHKITYNEEDEIHFLHMSKLLNEAVALEYLTNETVTEVNEWNISTKYLS